MKKLLFFVLIFILHGCGKEDDISIVGTWRAYANNIDNESVYYIYYTFGNDNLFKYWTENNNTYPSDGEYVYYYSESNKKIYYHDSADTGQEHGAYFDILELTKTKLVLTIPHFIESITFERWQ